MRRTNRHYRNVAVVCLFIVGVVSWPLSAELHAQTHSGGRDSDRGDHNSRVSPARRIKRDRHKPATNRNKPRPLDGSRNNHGEPDMNATETELRRLLMSDYADGYGAMAGRNRPAPRVVSNIVFAQAGDRPNRIGASDFVWQWGQFVDHDIDLTGGIDPPESIPIGIPANDLYFPASGSMDFNRSIYHIDRKGVRQQINEITGWIDASNVYGSDDERNAALRTLDGTGRLKTSRFGLLPRNLDGHENAGGSGNQFFLAGDVRSNEQIALTAMHTLFVREHNRWANTFHAEAKAKHSKKQAEAPAKKTYKHTDSQGNVVYSDRPSSGQSQSTVQRHFGKRRKSPEVDGDAIFERARAMVIAEIQHITYTEFLPVLLGSRALPRYSGYRPGTDARITNVFSTAAFRLGHSMLSPSLLRLGRDGQEIAAGHIRLRDAFFAPDQIHRLGIEPLLRGLSQQVCQDVDSFVIDDVRNFLFGDPGLGGFDLVSLNIQRGRDHGLPDYNSARKMLGLAPAMDFDEISSDPNVAERLRRAYKSVDNIDLWVGGMAEDKYRSGMLGELFHTLVKRQFKALRDGDRFWYSKVLSKEDRERVESLSLADIIRLNTNIDNEIQDNVFIVERINPGRNKKRRKRQ